MKRIVILTMILFTLPMAARQYEVTQEHKDRAAEIVKQMTLEEKIAYVGGYQDWYIRAIDRLGLPAVRMADGPQGVRNNTKSTLYPSGVAAAATWDKDLIYKMGESLGKDSRARGVQLACTCKYVFDARCCRQHPHLHPSRLYRCRDRFPPQVLQRDKFFIFIFK